MLVSISPGGIVSGSQSNHTYLSGCYSILDVRKQTVCKSGPGAAGPLSAILPVGNATKPAVWPALTDRDGIYAGQLLQFKGFISSL